jgi:serine/threonine protein kinase
MSDHCPRCNARPETVRTGALVSLKCTGCGAAYLVLPRVPEAPDDWDERYIGQRCGNCHLVSRVAVEEDGPVYEALHFGLNQPVHVKVLAPDLAGDPQMVQRFVRQAQLAAKVIHPRVPRVLDIGPSQDVPYVIRERTKGQRLSAKLNGSALSIEDVTATLPRIAEALAAVHDAGIVHLNVKPHSIILSEDGDIHLVGFTAAIRQTERPQIIAGSPGYTAAEHITGKDLSPSTDVYALGLLFFEMLTGRPAFHSEAEAAQFSMPAELQVDSIIPQRFAGLIHRMTQRSTDGRIASCAVVLKDLEPQSEAVTPPEPKEQGLTIAPPSPEQPLLQSDLESLFEPGARTSAQPTPAARPASSAALKAKAEPPSLPPASDYELQPPTPPVTPQPMQSAAPGAPPPATAPSPSVSEKIHMQCPHCGLVVRGLPEAFAKPIRCPDCNVESLFKPEPQETAPKPADAPAVGPAGAAAPSTTLSGKIHMQCPNCGVVVRGYPYVFVKPVRCPDCNVESLFKPEPQAAAPKLAEAPVVGPEEAAAPSTTSSGKVHMQCPHCGLVVRGYPYVFVKPIRCPDCNVESIFNPEPSETASKPDDKSSSGWRKWGSALLKRRAQGQGQGQ